ncbi:MADS-box transcription factor PHERES 2 [Carex littledalei]|uniref:MADS-box transcription factor PHERES 2 n=1 Tax=Carex littledalei TaxID=544730 RepID=A0A833VLK9_9POAL|nr:MADS-box transcription factor PHERES 2 [Carex littledalei]
MGRKPVTMELLGSPSIRAATFKQRKSSLFKKASELSILCGIEVCFAVSKGPDNQAPEVWPDLKYTLKVSQPNDWSNGKLDKNLAREVAEIQFQDIVAYSEPVTSLLDTMSDLLDIAEDMDMEEFFDGRPVDITEWKGIDDCLAPFLRGLDQNDGAS